MPPKRSDCNDHMGGDNELKDVMTDLQQTFVWLAKQCLVEKPKNVQRFCLEKLAMRMGLRVEVAPGLSREVSLLQNDNISDFVRDVHDARRAAHTTGPARDPSRAVRYVSSDSDTGHRKASSVNEYEDVVHGIYTSDGGEESEGSDAEVGAVPGKVTVTAEDVPSSVKDRNIKFFNRNIFSEDELERQVAMYVNDERMVRLFRAWDGDGSGAVDFVELVMALHKFENVASAGVDIAVAADALVEFVETDTERELKLPQFARVIIVFAKNTFGRTFDIVADHMLRVALSTSEAAVLQAARGVDVSEIEAFDKEEQKFVRETAQCVSVNVENNITRLRTTRAAGNAAKK